MKTKLKIGLFGFGCVGQGLYHVLHQTTSVQAEIKKICIKNTNKKRALDDAWFTTDGDVILQDPDINVVVELIDDAAAAFAIVKRALAHGKHVVTANKKMLAEHLDEILALQQQYDRSVLYEGAVCGSIPILRNLEEYYDNDLIRSIEGIFNGSTNYILTKVIEEKKSYTQALKQAQELGFAETDPSLDVKGFDPKFKLAIAITHAFGALVKSEEIVNIGIDSISERDLAFAREKGYSVKLVARAFKDGDKVYGLVAPQFVTADNLLSSIRHEFNAVSVEGAFSEKQFFVGKGAGSYPTGAAVLSDISALQYGYRYEYKKHTQQQATTFSNDASIEVFIRFGHEEKVSIGDFEEFQSGYASGGEHYMLGRASLAQIRKWSENRNIGIIVSPTPDFQPARAQASVATELVA